MRTVRDILIALLLIAGIVLTASLAWCVLAVRGVIVAFPARLDNTISREMSLTRAVLNDRSEVVLAALERQISLTRRDVLTLTDAHLTGIRSDAVNALTKTRLDLSAQLTRANDSLAEVALFRSDIAPTVDAVNTLAGPIGRNTLGLIAAGKVTMGETAQMARQIRIATPGLLTSAEKIASNSDRTTDATARAMGNIAEMTRPLPRWVRIPLQIAGPAVPIVLSLK